MGCKVPQTYKGMYSGIMTPEQSDIILKIRESQSIDYFRHMIFNFPNELLFESIDTEKSIRQLIMEKDIDPNIYAGELRDYQTTGAAFMYISPRSIIADGCGMGKTAEVSALINYLKQKNEMTRFLIAVENSALGQTAMELMKFTGLRVIKLPSTSAELKKVIPKIDWHNVDGIVVKHTTLKSDEFSKFLALNVKKDGTNSIFNTFFLDESSIVKNMNTKMATYTKNICNIVPRVHFMNATAFETCLMDVYNQMDMMYGDCLLPKQWKIERDYCTFSMKPYWRKVDGKANQSYGRELSGYKNQEQFKNALKLVYFGRSKKDVGLALPHVYKVYEIEPTKHQKFAIAQGHRYMEVLNCPSLISDMNCDTTRETSPKLDRLVELIENDFVDSSVMVYCFHRDAQKSIASELKKIGRKPVILNGEMDDDEKLQTQIDFNAGVYDCIITNAKKSLNLGTGDACIFYSVQTNPSTAFQIASRIDRSVNDNIKTFILLLYKDTDEEKFFKGTVKQRAKDARDLTIDSKTTVDFFIDSMEEE